MRVTPCNITVVRFLRSQIVQFTSVFCVIILNSYFDSNLKITKCRAHVERKIQRNRIPGQHRRVTRALNQENRKTTTKLRAAPVLVTKVCHEDLTKLRNEITTATSDQLKTFPESVTAMVKDTMANTNKATSMENNGEEQL